MALDDGQFPRGRVFGRGIIGGLFGFCADALLGCSWCWRRCHSYQSIAFPPTPAWALRGLCFLVRFRARFRARCR